MQIDWQKDTEPKEMPSYGDTDGLADWLAEGDPNKLAEELAKGDAVGLAEVLAEEDADGLADLLDLQICWLK